MEGVGQAKKRQVTSTGGNLPQLMAKIPQGEEMPDVAKLPQREFQEGKNTFLKIQSRDVASETFVPLLFILLRVYHV